MNRFIKIIVCLYCPLLYPLFEHDRAVSAGLKGNWEKAEHLLNDCVVRNPDNTQALYDAGVAAYRAKHYQQAAAYFNQVTESDAALPLIKEQAFFNAGNAYVEQKMLPQAVECYEKAIALNPANERAAHNLAVVKKMLEEQEKQKKDKEDSQKQKEQQQKEKNKQSQSEQKSDSTNQGNGDGSESSSNDSSSGEHGQSDDEDVPDKKNAEQQNPGSQKDGSNKNREQLGNDGKNSQPKNNAQGKGVENAQDDTHGDNRTGNANRGKEHETTPQQQSDKKINDADNSTFDNQKAQQSAALKKSEHDDAYAQDAWLTQILQEQEKADAKLTKRMIKANVGNQLAGHHGQNCW